MKDNETSLANTLSENKELISYLADASSGFRSLIEKGYKFPIQAFTENMTVEEIKNTKFIPFIGD